MPTSRQTSECAQTRRGPGWFGFGDNYYTQPQHCPGGLGLDEITDCIERGEMVKLLLFGSFVVRKKGQRMGRNPKTGKQVPISPRRVMVFKPSAILKQRLNAARSPSR